MNETLETNEFKSVLVEFKNQVDAPSDVGDVKAWIKRMRPAFERLETLVQSRRSRIHGKLYSEIANQDPSHNEQIARFDETDQEIEDILDIVRSHLDVIGLPKSEMEQDKVPDQALELSEHATALVQGIEEQEKAVAVWFAENFEPLKD